MRFSFYLGSFSEFFCVFRLLSALGSAWIDGFGVFVSKRDLVFRLGLRCCTWISKSIVLVKFVVFSSFKVGG